MSTKPRILIVEDEEAILQGLIDLFVYHGYEVDSSKDGKDGLKKALSGSYDLLLLDVMLPNIDGFTLCNEIRKVDRGKPIIMLTAKTSDEDIITGLTLGADDYVAKPFSVRELVLRVEAVLRRTRKFKDDGVFTVGEWEIDSKNLTGKTSLNQKDEIAFSRREIQILQFLIENSERPVSRDELLSEVWDYRKASTIETRTVDIHIAKLRKKIEKDPKNPTLLVTIRGEGYRLNEFKKR